jgi:protoheme ferro-lyase
LDLEAAQRAESYGMAFARTACVNSDSMVMAALAHRLTTA